MRWDYFRKSPWRLNRPERLSSRGCTRRAQKDLTFGVEIAKPNSVPTVMTGFRSADEVRVWIAKPQDDQLQESMQSLGKKHWLNSDGEVFRRVRSRKHSSEKSSGYD